MKINTKRQQVIDFAKQHAVVRPRDLVELSLPKDYLNQLSQEGISVSYTHLTLPTIYSV